MHTHMHVENVCPHHVNLDMKVLDVNIKGNHPKLIRNDPRKLVTKEFMFLL